MLYYLCLYTAVRYAFGTFPLSGDSYVIGLLGQKFYVEHADVEKYRENQNGEFNSSVLQII